MFHHLMPSGCECCADSLSPRTFSSVAVHPSCAVRLGMVRMCRDHRAGVVCQRNRDWRSYGVRRLKPWLCYLSGMNMHLDGWEAVEAEHLMPDDASSPLKGDCFS